MAKSRMLQVQVRNAKAEINAINKFFGGMEIVDGRRRCRTTKRWIGMDLIKKKVDRRRDLQEWLAENK